MNRELYPASMSPVQGDVFAAPGATQVTVTGLQGIPVDPSSPGYQYLLRFTSPVIGDPSGGSWVPSPDTNTAILVNSVPASDDYDIFVNAGPQVTVNGV